MSLPVSIVWVLTIIAMGIAYVVILNEKPKDSDKEKENDVLVNNTSHEAGAEKDDKDNLEETKETIEMK